MAAMNNAIDNGNVPEVKRLIAAGLDLDGRDSEQRTYLMRAVAMKQNAVVQALIDAGVNLDARDRLNMPALHHCAIENNAEAVKLLVKAGVDVDVRGFDSPNDGPTKSTALILAAQSKGLAAAQALIDAGADVNAITCEPGAKFRRSALFWAEKSKDPEMAALLTKYGAEKYPEGATHN